MTDLADKPMVAAHIWYATATKI